MMYPLWRGGALQRAAREHPTIRLLGVTAHEHPTIEFFGVAAREHPSV